MSRALAYVRVSTNEQVNGTSLDNQEKVIKRYAMDQDIELDQADIFREEGESAKFYDRPQLMAALRLLKDHKGKYDYFIVFKIDRLARDTNVHSMIKVKLKQSGVTLISATEPISDDPMGQAFEGMLSVWAQFDNQIRTARTTSGMRERTNQGAWPHDAPIGYRKTRLPSGASSIEPNHDAPMIKQLLEEFARGFLSVSDTVERGYELGIRTKTGKKRGWQSTKNILQNCLYMGYVRSDYTEGELRQGLHEPIITEETYYRIQSILLGHSRPSYKPSDVDYPLRGFVKHTCGHVLTGSAPSTGSGGRSPRYSCPVCRFSITGKAVSMMREPVHEKFMSLLSEVKPKKNTSELFRKILLQQWNNEYKEAARHTQQVNNEIAELERKRSKVLDLFYCGPNNRIRKESKV